MSCLRTITLACSFSNDFPCNITKCPLCKLNTVKSIWPKLHTLPQHSETMCHAQEPLLCFGYFGVISL